jgi:hypothetical protein
MKSMQVRLLLAMVAMWVAPAIAWLAYQLLHETIPGPNGLLVPLVIATVFLLGSWLLAWRPIISAQPRGWALAGLAFVIAAVAGIACGYAMMAAGKHPRVGMMAIFAAGNLTWVITTTLFWSKALYAGTETPPRNS